ncbi:LOW QUALITY PROTEIN: hypothetical protein MAR_019817 [Mya arenaria]|uniref:Uncharacterized protein n=1 Tax=Mya arenaria TaxID=6604 RepID=A0ABY7E6N3_MYAAR|nr:LOW QUALITY PROTEIN: hypothetical protein MAR_019817 [Mya arenaria]
MTCSQQLLKLILDMCRNAGLYAIMAVECQDCSSKEQRSLCVRSMSPHKALGIHSGNTLLVYDKQVHQRNSNCRVVHDPFGRMCFRYRAISRSVLCETRWTARSDALSTFKNAFPVVVYTLEELQDDHDFGATSNTVTVAPVNRRNYNSLLETNMTCCREMFLGEIRRWKARCPARELDQVPSRLLETLDQN